MTGSDARSFSQIGVHLGLDAEATCHTFADRPPILVIRVGAVSCSVSARKDIPEGLAAAVRFAGELTESAWRFELALRAHRRDFPM
ncbi:hypothetical protein [Sinosporangium siamense]|uniref:Uncharacterized protein n=1 Tax=Sinosporangium siamense TaxID=1367973 RepID=A0A919VC78_9ACTN|nr:hypothetical protein [Sinosporangium siamense]GII97322.1 hypothetical protein Ssi02_75530 [Sinosporangium siamense]